MIKKLKHHSMAVILLLFTGHAEQALPLAPLAVAVFAHEACVVRDFFALGEKCTAAGAQLRRQSTCRGNARGSESDQAAALGAVNSGWTGESAAQPNLPQLQGLKPSVRRLGDARTGADGARWLRPRTVLVGQVQRSVGRRTYCW